MSGQGEKRSTPSGTGAAFDAILLSETTRTVANWLADSPDPRHLPWDDLSSKERADLTGWVELVFLAQRESLRPAFQIAGVAVDDE